MQLTTVQAINEAMSRVYQKHGPIPEERGHQLAIITEELGEAAMAHLDEEPENYKDEILDLVVAGIRAWEAL